MASECKTLFLYQFKIKLFVAIFYYKLYHFHRKCDTKFERMDLNYVSVVISFFSMYLSKCNCIYLNTIKIFCPSFSFQHCLRMDIFFLEIVNAVNIVQFCRKVVPQLLLCSEYNTILLTYVMLVSLRPILLLLVPVMMVQDVC